jgi:hypothetical protein
MPSGRLLCLKIFLHNLFVTLSSIAAAQESHLILKGEVTDLKTGTPLGYANVMILGKAIGTTSNIDGAFEFHIPISNSRDTLSISCIGYETYKMPIAGLQPERTMRVGMQPATYELREVIVRDKPYTVHSLLEDVLKNYDTNYGTSPYEMEAFYREVRRTDEKSNYLIEAAVHIYKASYKKENAIELRQIRKSSGPNEYGGENRLAGLLKNDYVSNPYMGFYKRYRKKNAYVIEDTTTIDNHPVYVVSFGCLPSWKQTIYINANDFAIIQYNVETYYGKDGNLVMGREGKNTVFRYRYLKVVNSFSRRSGKYYLNYIKMKVEHDLFNEREKRIEKYNVWDREILINNVNSTNVRAIDPQYIMRNEKLEDQLKGYNEPFWKNYNILMRTPLQDQIVRDLEKETTLNEQFSKQGETIKKKK